MYLHCTLKVILTKGVLANQMEVDIRLFNTIYVGLANQMEVDIRLFNTIYGGLANQMEVDIRLYLIPYMEGWLTRWKLISGYI